MSPIESLPNAAETIGRLLLAAGSRRSARAAGARITDPARIEPSAAVSTRAPDEPAAHGAVSIAAGDESSSFGPAAVYEPSERARETVLSERPGQHEAEASADDAGALQREELTEDEQKQVDKLKRRDQEVRRHESAHKAAAGAHARGGAKFEFQTGPDGKRYAVGGEVAIDPSPVSGNPSATISKMRQIRRAALAPADPSGQDRAVAAQAAQAEREARAELAEERRSPAGGYDPQGRGSAEAGRVLDVTA